MNIYVEWGRMTDFGGWWTQVDGRCERALFTKRGARRRARKLAKYYSAKPIETREPYKYGFGKFVPFETWERP